MCIVFFMIGSPRYSKDISTRIDNYPTAHGTTSIEGLRKLVRIFSPLAASPSCPDDSRPCPRPARSRRPPCSPACLRPHRSPSFLSSRSHRSDRSAPFRRRREYVPSSVIQSRCPSPTPTPASPSRPCSSRLRCPLRRRRPPPTPPPPSSSTHFDC